VWRGRVSDVMVFVWWGCLLWREFFDEVMGIPFVGGFVEAIL
jgi:hypothetical protein